MNLSYFKFEVLPAEVKKLHGIRSKTRLDCTAYSDKFNFRKELKRFTNAKGQLFLYLSSPENYVQANPKRVTDLGLTNGGNFTSLYTTDTDFPFLAFGDYQDWGLLFLFEKDYKAFEMLCIPNGRFLVKSNFQKLIDNEFSPDLEKFRKEAVPFFDYLA